LILSKISCAYLDAFALLISSDNTSFQILSSSVIKDFHAVCLPKRYNWLNLFTFSQLNSKFLSKIFTSVSFSNSLIISIGSSQFIHAILFFQIFQSQYLSTAFGRSCFSQIDSSSNISQVIFTPHTSNRYLFHILNSPDLVWYVLIIQLKFFPLLKMMFCGLSIIEIVSSSLSSILIVNFIGSAPKSFKFHRFVSQICSHVSNCFVIFILIGGTPGIVSVSHCLSKSYNLSKNFS
jgi:hypothetical protein